MEAVTAIGRNLLRNTRTVLILGVILGLLLGLIIGWGLWPVQWTNATPQALGPAYQDEYLRMVIESFDRTGDQQTALNRWNALGPAGVQTLQRVQGSLDPGLVQRFAAAVQAPITSGGFATPTTTPGGTDSGLSTWVILGSLLVLILVGAGTLYLLRLFQKSSAVVTPVMEATRFSRQAGTTNYEELGYEHPLTQTLSTFVAGYDLFDESFTIETQSGEFLGEYGIGIADTVGVGKPKKVTAFELWLFDKNDIKTTTKVLMSEHAFNDENYQNRLKAKGDLILAGQNGQVILETNNLQVLATIVDMAYGKDPAPPNSYFERITIEFAVWKRQADKK